VACVLMAVDTFVFRFVGARQGGFVGFHCGGAGGLFEQVVVAVHASFVGHVSTGPAESFVEVVVVENEVFEEVLAAVVCFCGEVCEKLVFRGEVAINTFDTKPVPVGAVG